MIDIYNETKKRNMLRINKFNLKTEVEMILEKYSLPESSVGTVPFDKSPPRLWKSFEKYLESFSLHWNGRLGKY